MDTPRVRKNRTGRNLAVAVATVGLVLLSVALTRIRPAAPSVDRSSIVVDSVRRGDVTREIRANGTLVPERIQWITAETSARVERVLAQTGQHISANDPILSLSNPDLLIQAMQADQQVRQAEIDLVTLRTNLRSQELGQAASIASMRTQLLFANQELVVAESLAKDRLISVNDENNKRAQRDEMKERLSLEEQKLALMRESSNSQAAMHKDQITQLMALAANQHRRLLSLQVRAPEAGVLQDLSLQLGQWVPEGTTLAKVVQPGQLKAVLRIFESQARDVQLGQRASIDTHNGFIPGHVSRKDPSAQSGTVTIDVALDGPLPLGALPDVAVEGTVQIEKLTGVLYVTRPISTASEGTVGLFRLEPDGGAAVRVPVGLGRSSVSTVEILRGLRSGDRVIVSDVSSYDNVDRIRIK